MLAFNQRQVEQADDLAADWIAAAAAHGGVEAAKKPMIAGALKRRPKRGELRFYN